TGPEEAGISLEEAAALTGLQRDWCCALTAAGRWPVVQHHPERVSRAAVEGWTSEMMDNARKDPAVLRERECCIFARWFEKNDEGVPELTNEQVQELSSSLTEWHRYGEPLEEVVQHLQAWLSDAVCAGYLPKAGGAFTLL